MLASRPKGARGRLPPFHRPCSKMLGVAERAETLDPVTCAQAAGAAAAKGQARLSIVHKRALTVTLPDVVRLSTLRRFPSWRP